MPAKETEFTVREIAFDDKGGADRDFGSALDSFDLNETPQPSQAPVANMTPRSMAAAIRQDSGEPSAPAPTKRRGWFARLLACLFGRG